jgi:Glycosyltransferase
MSKKILIICASFYPANKIGALRPTKIAGKLIELGYEVDVYTRYETNNPQYKAGELFNNIYFFPYNKTHVGVREKKNIPVKNKRKKGYIYKQLSYLRNNIFEAIKSAKDYKQFKNQCTDILISNSYNTVFSTYSPLLSLKCGLYYKMKNPEINWICDFRDPVVTKFVPIILKPYFNHLQNKACKFANHIVTVSNGYKKAITKGKYQEKTHMIPNGYDVKDNIFSMDAEEDKSILNITYVGALYSGERDLSPLFKALRQLIDERNIVLENICINYAGKEFKILHEQASQYNMQKYLKNHGVLSRTDCLKLQFSSHFLVLSTWNYKGEEGVFPGKFLEYMLIGQPIISIVDGNLADSEVSQVMNEGKFGITYESINDEKDFPELKLYIRTQYEKFLSEGKVEFFPEQKVLDRYNYENIIKRIEALL